MTGLEKNVSRWRKLDPLQSALSGYALAVAIRGWESLCLCPGCDSQHPEEWLGSCFCLHARLGGGAPSLCDYSFNLALMVWLHQSQGRSIFVFASWVSWVRETIFTFSQFKKEKQKTMTEKDLYLLLPVLAQSTVGPGTATPGDLTTGIPASSEGEQGETAIGTIGDKKELGGKAEEGGKGEV